MAIQIDIARFRNLVIEAQDDGVWVVTLNRPTKRNALDSHTIEELVDFFSAAPRAGVRAVVLAGSGDHFCAGLDLIEHHQADRSPADFMHLCLRWHEAFNKMEYGGVPIIAALHGAVVGGGLELASAAHVRVMDQTACFALPEGQRGLFTGGGATIRVTDLVGKSRMIDMMLTGRVYQGQKAVDLGLAQYIIDGCSFEKAMELAPQGGAEPTAVQFRDLFGGQSSAQHVGDGRVLCRGCHGRRGEYPARSPFPSGCIRRQKRRARASQPLTTG